MPTRMCFIVLLCVLASGCGSKKSTAELITDLKSAQEKDRVVAVRLLPQRPGDAEETVPALIEALKDKNGDVRWSAAIGLGGLGERAKPAIPALEAAQKDRDGRVREAASVALSRIDPSFVPKAAPVKARQKQRMNGAK